MKNIQPPVVTQINDTLKDYKVEHPCFGMLSFSRVHGGDPNLYGTSIKHNEKIQLTLKRGSYDRHLNMNWYHGREELFELEMSYTQFVELITHMNMEGVPVTLRRVMGEVIPSCPVENPVEIHRTEYKKHLDKIYGQSKSLIAKVADKFKEKKSFNKKEQEEILSMLHQISMNIGCNQDFQLSKFEEQMDKTIAEGKGEIEAFYQNKMYQIATQAMVKDPETFIAGCKPPVMIEEEPQPKRKLKKVEVSENDDV